MFNQTCQWRTSLDCYKYFSSNCLYQCRTNLEKSMAYLWTISQYSRSSWFNSCTLLWCFISCADMWLGSRFIKWTRWIERQLYRWRTHTSIQIRLLLIVAQSKFNDLCFLLLRFNDENIRWWKLLDHNESFHFQQQHADETVPSQTSSQSGILLWIIVHVLRRQERRRNTLTSQSRRNTLTSQSRRNSLLIDSRRNSLVPPSRRNTLTSHSRRNTLTDADALTSVSETLLIN